MIPIIVVLVTGFLRKMASFSGGILTTLEKHRLFQLPVCLGPAGPVQERTSCANREGGNAHKMDRIWSQNCNAGGNWCGYLISHWRRSIYVSIKKNPMVAERLQWETPRTFLRHFIVKSSREVVFLKPSGLSQAMSSEIPWEQGFSVLSAQHNYVFYVQDTGCAQK